MFRLDGLSAFAWSGLGILLCCVVFGGLWLAQKLVRSGHGQALDVEYLQPCGCPIGGVRYSCLKCRAEMYGGADPVAIHAARIPTDVAYPGFAEPSPLLREIYAAQSLAREGVDVYAKAPREMAP